MTQFSELGLAEPVLRALAQEGYDAPTPIQAQSIPSLLDGKDLLGIAQTGTGKTAAFALPILDRLSKIDTRTPKGACRVLVLAPTRELAAQIGDSFRAYGRFLNVRMTVVVGGVAPGPQIKAITPGVEVLVATPGRLLDHVDSGKLSLKHVEVVVLDEADHMLDLGFLPPIKRIIKMLPRDRQNLFFSATMPGQIGQLAGDMLSDPVKVSVTPVATTQERVEQSVYLIERTRKRQLLAELLDNPVFKRTLVFTRTKRGADRVARHLEANKISAAAIHGNKSQNQRERALNAFKDGQINVLVATDIAARGIDVDSVSHVVNFELPNVPESYVHRIGRTARGGASGTAIAFCDEEERGLLRDIEKTTRQSIPVIDRRDAKAAAAQEAESAEAREANRGRRSSGGGQARGNAGRGGAGGNRGNGRGGRSDARGGNAPRRDRDDARKANQRRDGEGSASASNDTAAKAPSNPALEKSKSRYKGGLKSKPANGRGNGSDNGASHNDGRKRPAKKVDSNGNRRDQPKGDNSISSGLSFLGSTEERRANGNGGNGSRNTGPQGKRGGVNRNRNQRGAQSGGQPGGAGRANTSGKQPRRERA
ncbi:DEAD/DEAH box helicase [Thalassospira sp. HF15]|uniref:DEAD/DEAH box helicase n=1 Tax=Thalassospira sp. HF15 TaxID=2722755 RepID=UPI00142F8C20|nr:DEAD/DEAH box helicase [Thalassospira sp. HF15]NIY76290.1 DEAD/DEAH box helicase [Thalassospira sp. HF15]